MKTCQVSPKPPTPAELLRLSLGFRRRHVAIAAGLSPKTLERVERGLTWIKPETLQQLAEVLGIDPDVYVVAILQSWRQARARKRAACQGAS